MFKKILESSIHFIWHNHKFIRLSFITSFFHSLTVVALFLYNINNILHYRFASWVDYNIIFNFLKWELGVVVVIVIIGIIGYELLYPFGQWAMIYYLENDNNKLSKAIGQWLDKFFPMFEFINLAMMLGAVTVLTTILRLISLEIIWNPIVIILMSIWWICALVTAILRPYVKYALTLKNMNLSDALKYSAKLSTQNLGITLKFLLLEWVLLIRFIINLLLILGIPLLIIYLASIMNILWKVTHTIVTIVAISLIVICAYLNAIIEAFFTTYRYKVYKHISAKTETN